MDQLTNLASPVSASTEPPWYRQFWPWFLIALPATVVVACIFTIKLAIQSGDTLVRDDYYKDGLAINESIARDQRAVELGIKGVLQISPSNVLIQLESAQPDFLQLSLRHPFDAKQDISILLHWNESDGIYQAQQSIPAQRWYIELSPVSHDANHASEWRIQAEQDFRNSSFLSFGR